MTPPHGRLGRTSRLSPLAALAVSGAIAVAACGGGATPSPSESASASASPSLAASPSPAPSASPAASIAVIGETGPVELSGVGFHITLPDGWRAISLDEGSVDAIAELFPADSEFAQMLQGQAGTMALAGVKLFAIDTRSESIVGGSSPTLNVIVQAKPAGLSLQLLAAVAQSQLEALEASSDVSVDNVTLPAGEAVKATYTLEQALADGTSLEASGTQYYLASASSLFIVTLTGSSAAGADLASTFEGIADSIEID